MDQQLSEQEILDRVARVAGVSTFDVIKVFHALLSEAYVCYSEHQAGRLSAPKSFLDLGGQVRADIERTSTSLQIEEQEMVPALHLRTGQLLPRPIKIIESAWKTGASMLGRVIYGQGKVSVNILGVSATLKSEEYANLRSLDGKILAFKILEVNPQGGKVVVSPISHEKIIEYDPIMESIVRLTDTYRTREDQTLFGPMAE